MNVLSLGRILPLCCKRYLGLGKGERFEANTDNLVGVTAHCSIGYLFPTWLGNKKRSYAR